MPNYAERFPRVKLFTQVCDTQDSVSKWNAISIGKAEEMADLNFASEVVAKMEKRASQLQIAWQHLAQARAALYDCP